MTASFVGKTEPLCSVLFFLRSLLREARAHENRESNEEGDDVNVAAERSDWSVWMNLSSLHALAEQHLIQTAEEFESVPHQHTKYFKPQRAAHIQQEKRAREKRE